MNKKMAAFPILLAAALAAGCPACAAQESKESETVFTSGLLQVTVPEDIAQICDTGTSENGMSFREIRSAEAFGGGFVASLQVYGSVEEYGYLPHFERVGEIHLEDGTILNVVAEYPTDVQFDPQDKTSEENYNRISEAFQGPILTSLAATEGTFIAQEETDTTSIYSEILADLTESISSGAGAEALMDKGYSYLYSYYYGEEDPLSAIGYAFADLDHDGYSELLLGAVGESTIFDLFVQKDGEISHPVSAGERDSWYLTGQDSYYAIRNDASGGAALSAVSIFSLDCGELNSQVSFVYDEGKDKEDPWFISYGFGEDEQVSEEEWNQRLGNYGEIMVPEYQPL